MRLSDDRPFTPKNDRTSLLTSSPPCLIACKKAVEVRSPFRQFPTNPKLARPQCDRPIELSVMIGQVLKQSDILRYDPNDSGLTLC